MKTFTGKYDYIIAGLGCAGLSLAVNLKHSQVKFEKVLLVDRELRHENDRTWCFWSCNNREAWYRSLIHQQWSHFRFRSASTDRTLQLSPYSYQMIRSADFYQYCLNELLEDPRFEITTEAIMDMETRNNSAFLRTNSALYAANYIFNSAIRVRAKDAATVDYIQHFKGWVIETEQELFDPACPLLMDFCVEQHGECRFVYILPFDKKKALVEYTVFSDQLLDEEVYDEALKGYVTSIAAGSFYKIIETEKGEIPMTDDRFLELFGNRVINIGTAAGASKGSSGYTFYFIQKHIAQLIQQLEQNKYPEGYMRLPRFRFYDAVFLDVLSRKKIPAVTMFSKLFEKNTPRSLLAFLNEESTWLQDLAVIHSMPKKQFVVSAIRKLF